MKNQTQNNPNSHNTHTRALVARAGEGSFFLVLLLLGLFALTGCGGGGGGGSTAVSRDTNPNPPAPVVIQMDSVWQGLGYLCWLQGQIPERIWCWASEQAALDNGDAGQAIGATDLNPILMYTAPGTTGFTAYDHGVCFFNTCIGNTNSGTANVQHYSVPGCTVSPADTLTCPALGNQHPVLTFQGMTFSSFRIPLLYKQDPFRRYHTPMYLLIKKVCLAPAGPTYIQRTRAGARGLPFSTSGGTYV